MHCGDDGLTLEFDPIIQSYVDAFPPLRPSLFSCIYIYIFVYTLITTDIHSALALYSPSEFRKNFLVRTNTGGRSDPSPLYPGSLLFPPVGSLGKSKTVGSLARKSCQSGIQSWFLDFPLLLPTSLAAPAQQGHPLKAKGGHKEK